MGLLVFWTSSVFFTTLLLLKCCLHILTNGAHDQFVGLWRQKTTKQNRKFLKVFFIPALRKQAYHCFLYVPLCSTDDLSVYSWQSLSLQDFEKCMSLTDTILNCQQGLSTRGNPKCIQILFFGFFKTFLF